VSNQTLHPLHYDNEVQAGVLSETPALGWNHLLLHEAGGRAGDCRLFIG